MCVDQSKAINPVSKTTPYKLLSGAWFGHGELKIGSIIMVDNVRQRREEESLNQDESKRASAAQTEVDGVVVVTQAARRWHSF